MLNEMNNDEIDEQLLNPPPRQYRVSYRCKVWFLCFCLLAVGIYFYMIIERRLWQNRALVENQMAAVKFTEPVAANLSVIDPKTEQEIVFNPHGPHWILLNVWATWCPPCKEEMPSLELLAKKMQGRMEIVAISVDDDLAAVQDFIKLNKPTFTVYWDKYKNSLKNLSVEKYPETFLISPEGLITTQFSGPRDWAKDTAMDYFAKVIN